MALLDEQIFNLAQDNRDEDKTKIIVDAVDKIKLCPDQDTITGFKRAIKFNDYCYNLSIDEIEYQHMMHINRPDLYPYEPNYLSVRQAVIKKFTDEEVDTFNTTIARNAIDRAWWAYQNWFNGNMPYNKRPIRKTSNRRSRSFRLHGVSIKIIHHEKEKDEIFLPSTHKKGIKKLWTTVKFYGESIATGEMPFVTIIQEHDGWYAAINYKKEIVKTSPRLDVINAVDPNEGRFVHAFGVFKYNNEKLKELWRKIEFYDRALIKKRHENKNWKRSKTYKKLLAKRRKLSNKVINIQKNDLNNFTSWLISEFAEIHLETLNVEKMKMSKGNKKNLSRSKFGEFVRQVLYKAEWQGRPLVQALWNYPSTQRCSKCGFVKTNQTFGGKLGRHGDRAGNGHDTYKCYNCGVTLNRDENAVQNLVDYSMQAFLEWQKTDSPILKLK